MNAFQKPATPLTDATVTGNSEPSQDEYEDLAFFARNLETELAEMTARAVSLSLHLPPETLVGDVQRWRDEAKAQLAELATARAALAQCEERLKEVDDLLTNCGLLSYITAHADNLRRECGENEKWGIETFNAIDKDYADVKRALQILSAARNSRP